MFFLTTAAVSQVARFDTDTIRVCTSVHTFAQPIDDMPKKPRLEVISQWCSGVNSKFLNLFTKCKASL